jgi:hypothetical protein
VAAAGIGVTSLFNGKEFELFKNGRLSYSNLNNWKGNGKVELKNNNKKEYTNDSVADGMGNTVAGFSIAISVLQMSLVWHMQNYNINWFRKV